MDFGPPLATRGSCQPTTPLDSPERYSLQRLIQPRLSILRCSLSCSPRRVSQVDLRAAHDPSHMSKECRPILAEPLIEVERRPPQNPLNAIGQRSQPPFADRAPESDMSLNLGLRCSSRAKTLARSVIRDRLIAQYAPDSQADPLRDLAKRQSLRPG